jgi:hypothetical protein
MISLMYKANEKFTYTSVSHRESFFRFLSIRWPHRCCRVRFISRRNAPIMMSAIEQDQMSMEKSSRLQICLNSTQKKSNTFWKQYSKHYAELLLAYSRVILVFSLLFAIILTGCSVGLMHMRTIDQTDFFMTNSESVHSAHRLRNIFGNDTEFRVHQQLNLYPGLDIILKRKSTAQHENDTNMLDERIIDEVRCVSVMFAVSRRHSSTDVTVENPCRQHTRTNTMWLTSRIFLFHVESDSTNMFELIEQIEVSKEMKSTVDKLRLSSIQLNRWRSLTTLCLSNNFFRFIG